MKFTITLAALTAAALAAPVAIPPPRTNHYPQGLRELQHFNDGPVKPDGTEIIDARNEICDEGFDGPLVCRAKREESPDEGEESPNEDQASGDEDPAASEDEEADINEPKSPASGDPVLSPRGLFPDGKKHHEGGFSDDPVQCKIMLGMGCTGVGYSGGPSGEDPPDGYGDS